MDCVFCRIARKEIPSQALYEDEQIFAFKDINPVAPFHALIIPKEHFRDLTSVPWDRAEVLGQVQLVAAQLAREHKLDQTGYRVVANTGPDAGQVVFHVHYHLVGGRPLGSLSKPTAAR